MKIDSIVIGQVTDNANDVITGNINIVNTSDDGTDVYIVNELTNQRIKLAPNIPKENISLVDEISFTVNHLPEFPLYHNEYTFSDGDRKLFPTVNNLSFNPFIYEIRDSAKFVQQDLIFLTILEKNFTILSYETDMDIISASHDKKNGKISCILRYNRSRKNGNTFVLFGRYVNEKRFCKFTLVHANDTEGLLSTQDFHLTREEITNCSKLTKQRKGKSIVFNYSAKELPKVIICNTDEVDMMRAVVAEREKTNPESLMVVTVPDDYDWGNKNIVKATIGEQLRRNRAAIISPKISIPFQIARFIGLDYLFKVFTLGNGKNVISAVKRK